MCSIEGCNLEAFEKSDKCILHCEKDDWYKEEKGKKIWKQSEDKIDLFWNEIQNLIEHNYLVNDSKIISFSKIIFPAFQRDFSPGIYEVDNDAYKRNNKEEMYCSFIFYSHVLNELIDIFKTHSINFDRCIFLDELFLVRNSFDKEVIFSNCVLDRLLFPFSNLNGAFKFNYCKFNYKDLRLQNRSFKKEFILINCEEIMKINLENTVFESLFSVFNSKFNNGNFRNIDFKSDIIFDKARFSEIVEFQYTNFFGVAYFQDMKVLNGISLKSSTFHSKTNFLGISENVLDRETARIIKDSFEEQNNIIEANKFYALEMKERDSELTWTKDFFEKLVFSLHSWSSNHSQDWLLALFWILNISFVSSIFTSFINEDSSFVKCLDITLSMTILLIIIGFILFKVKEFIGNWSYFIITSIIYGTYTNIFDRYSLDNIANNINPFSVMNSWDDITFGELIYKIIIGYLIYQFIVSIRQNTRRK